ncbi:hypothetical protein BU26DRAFT_560101 [Trematosphaeria pertusa]|uniref:Heterokaryon incompatibility domain-containing protein n=1 Tax=Trematosphaeria pertusa TaxID=390896 RepID=A0A6A6IQB4_9PLEO|nr:uncharacterized protein BU26DRAFT_560101 [Trematosphaeria pertusa]KAF2252745.1 hypothetical protein BU26DRAFT_560101 [Trematosphaeria pertusa]
MPQLRNVIHAAATLCPEKEMRPVDFIWLDIACIDQRESEPRSAAEVGRQAAIFKGAQTVFIWMTTMPSDRSEHDFGNIDWLWLEPSQHTEETLPNVITAMLGFLDVLCDPWFSSLWTLQEAYLRPDAYILSQPGRLIVYDVYGDETILALRDILVYGVNCEGFCNQRIALQPGVSIWTQIRDRINERGLIALRARNSMALLGAATLRNASVSVDRVYGIQQVFGFRLGNSSLRSEPNQTFTLQELEDQLGENLLITEPFLSQSHVFLRAVPLRDCWKMNARSVVPTKLLKLNSNRSRNYSPPCSFWVDHCRPGPHPVHWKGPTISLKRLADAFHWMVTNSEVAFLADDIDRARQHHLDVFPDITEEFHTSPEAQHEYLPKYGPIPQGERTAQFIEWLLQTYSPRSVEVLLLGVELEHGRDQNYALGLIFVEHEPGIWGRVGLCQWWMLRVRSAKRGLFEGEGPEWAAGEGVFGYVGRSGKDEAVNTIATTKEQAN